MYESDEHLTSVQRHPVVLGEKKSIKKEELRTHHER
jgi:hypothetical protein